MEDEEESLAKSPVHSVPSSPCDGPVRCGFVAIIGAPNAGKSTLVNQLVGAKVSIVSRKVQTTRMMVRGLVVVNNSQIVLVDTPGIFKPQKRLDRAMVQAAWSGASDADYIVVLIDALRGVDEDVARIITRLKETDIPLMLALNKVDQISNKAQMLPLVEEVARELEFQQTFMLSALNGDGVEALRNTLAGQMPEGPWHFPSDDISDLPMRLLAAEITREKIYDRLHQELPYAITVETGQWQDFKNKSVRIEQTIFVEQESQKKIVIGKGGQTIKAISAQARAELADIIGHPVHLFLFVKVRRNWADDPERYRELGLEFPES